MEIGEFLLARIAEDEELARDAAGWDPTGRERASGQWLRTGISSIEDDQQQSVIYSDNNYVSDTVADHVARWDPARVLAECDAKRRIVQDYLHEVRDYRAGYTNVQPSHRTVKHLTLPYADHPDYRPEWKP